MPNVEERTLLTSSVASYTVDLQSKELAVDTRPNVESAAEYKKDPCLVDEKSENTEDVKVRRPPIEFMKKTPPF